MCGDFNCDYNASRDHGQLKDLVKLYSFSQIIKTFTRVASNSKTIIDLSYTSNKSNVVDTIVYNNSMSDHSVIGINRKMSFQRFQPKTIKCRDYSNYNKDLLKDKLRSIPCENCLVYSEGWDLFKYYVQSAIEKHAPMKEKQIQGKQNPWMTREISQLINSRGFQRRFNQTDNNDS